MGSNLIVVFIMLLVSFILPILILMNALPRNILDFLKKIIVPVLLVISGFLIVYSFLAVDEWTIGVVGDEARGQIGDKVGGIMNPIIAIAGVLVTGLAFWMQYQANELVRKQFKIQQFESQLYKILEAHNQNVENWKFKSRLDLVDRNGKECAYVLVNHFNEVFSDLNNLVAKYNIKPSMIVSSHYYSKLIEKVGNTSIIYRALNKQQEDNLILNNLINNKVDLLILYELSHYIFFFGVNEEGLSNILSHTSDSYDAEVLSSILKYFSLFHFNNKNEFTQENLDTSKHPLWSNYIPGIYLENNKCKLVLDFGSSTSHLNINNFKALYPNNINIIGLDSYSKLDKYYNGVQNILGHYYRNLFMAYKFIDKFDLIEDEKELLSSKRNYAKLFRTQLSNYQQILFYLNSLNGIGGEWEINYPNKVNRKFISKYNIIKNIPKGDRTKFHIELFYPNVKYEDKVKH